MKKIILGLMLILSVLSFGNTTHYVKIVTEWRDRVSEDEINKVIEKEEINKNTKLIDIKTSTINSINYVILIFEKSK